MQVTTVTTADQSLLRGIRRTLDEADDALLCVAFVHSRGVHLLERELQALARRGRARLVVTTAFDATGGAGLAVAVNAGAEVHTLNPGAGSTYHPKVYLGRRGESVSAFVGSANLTGGLATNVEVGVLLQGTTRDQPLRDLSSWAEHIVARSEPWLAHGAEAPGDDELAPDLLAAIEAAARVSPVFTTLRSRAPNRVTEVTASEVHVETARSSRRRGRAEPIPAWMFNLAWDSLHARGELTNATLLKELRVHRSSAVCAILARLPGVEPMTGGVVGVRLRGGALAPLRLASSKQVIQ